MVSHAIEGPEERLGTSHWAHVEGLEVEHGTVVLWVPTYAHSGLQGPCITNDNSGSECFSAKLGMCELLRIVENT